MDTTQAAQICARFGLGSAVAEPQPVAGGFLHRMWHLATTHGRFAVKHLNVRRPTMGKGYRSRHPALVACG